MRRALALVLLVAVAVVGAACQRPGPGRGEARLRLDDGDAVAGGLRDGSIVQRGELVRATEGTPVLELSGRNRRLTLRPGARVRVADPIVLLGGDVLSSGSTAVDAGVADVDARGTVRVTRTLASSVRVYEGSAVVSSAGRSVTVPARKDASVPALGLVPRTGKWVTLDREDAWDQEYLGTAIELTDAFEAGGRSFTSAVRASPSVNVAGLVTGLSDDAWQDTLLHYAPGEALVGGVIATVARDPLATVFGLRSEGAAWGVVAVERVGDRSGRAVDALYDALGAWAGRNGLSGVGGARPAVPLDASRVVQAGTAVLGNSSSGGGGGGGSAPSTPSTARPPGGSTTLPGVTTPTVGVPTITVPNIPVPTITAPSLVTTTTAKPANTGTTTTLPVIGTTTLPVIGTLPSISSVTSTTTTTLVTVPTITVPTITVPTTTLPPL